MWKILANHVTNHIPTHSDHTLTTCTYQSDADHIATTYWPYMEHIPTAYQHIPIQLNWPHTNCIPTTYWSNLTDHIPTTVTGATYPLLLQGPTEIMSDIMFRLVSKLVLDCSFHLINQFIDRILDCLITWTADQKSRGNLDWGTSMWSTFRFYVPAGQQSDPIFNWRIQIQIGQKECTPNDCKAPLFWKLQIS